MTIIKPSNVEIDCKNLDLSCTDISEVIEISNQYNKFRGLEVIKFGKNHLDDFFPLSNCSFHDVKRVKIIDSKLFFYTKYIMAMAV